MWVWVYTSGCIRVYTCVFVCMCIYIHVYVYIHLSFPLSLSLYMYLSISIYMYIYIYIYIYVCMYRMSCTHTYMHARIIARLEDEPNRIKYAQLVQNHNNICVRVCVCVCVCVYVCVSVECVHVDQIRVYRSPCRLAFLTPLSLRPDVTALPPKFLFCTHKQNRIRRMAKQMKERHIRIKETERSSRKNKVFSRENVRYRKSYHSPSDDRKVFSKSQM